MKIHSVPLLAAAVVLGFCLLAFVHKFELFGVSCYYVGSFSLSTTCIKPWVYYGGWLVAVVLAVFGIFGPFSRSSVATKTEKS